MFILIRSGCMFFYQKIQTQKLAKQISNSNFKNSGISGRKINSTLGQPYFLSKDQFCVQIALSCVCLVNWTHATSFQRSMDSSFWIDLFVPREFTNKRKFTIYTLQCTHDNDNCDYNLTYVHRQRYLTFVRHFYCGTEPIHSVFDTRLPADFVWMHSALWFW